MIAIDHRPRVITWDLTSVNVIGPDKEGFYFLCFANQIHINDDIEPIHCDRISSKDDGWIEAKFNQITLRALLVRGTK